MLFRFEQVSKSFGARNVLEGVSFQVNPGEHVGLVGRNGAGKTTIFRLLLGQSEPDSGLVERARSIRIGLLEQQVGIVHDGNVRDAALAVFAEVHDVEAEMRTLEHDMAEAASDELASILERYSKLQHRYEALDGFTIHARAESVLFGLGFSRDDLELPAKTLSGGQRARLALARLLLEQPDVLLLDEPTNHLDVDAVEWLEEFLAGYTSAYVIISHDRFLLDRTCNRILAIERGELVSYHGNYSRYLLAREERRLLAEKRYREQQELIERTEEFIRRNLAGQKTKQAKSRRNMLERMERIARVAGEERSANFRLGEAERSGREVLVVKNLTVGFPGVLLVEGLNLRVHRGDRVAIMGPNGAGKTTLLLALAGRLEQMAGEYEWGHNVSIGFYDQHLADLDPLHDMMQELRMARPGATDPELRAYLSRFLFTGDDPFKKVDSLSGGERSRLSLAKLISGSHNVLLLDEPTNHLDIPAREALEAALEEFGGTVIVVSHDRYFVDRICGRLVNIEEGKAEVFEGTYSDWHTELTLRREVQSAPPAARTRRRQRSTRAPTTGRDVAQIEVEIAAVESEIEDLERLIADGEIASDHTRLLPLTLAHEQATARLKSLVDEWEAASTSVAPADEAVE
jgi:ATP-binding cassette subfamily F protein 3